MDQQSFTPLFDDQPMMLDQLFDMPLGDWPATEWAPGSQIVVTAPQEVVPFGFDFRNSNQFIDDDLTTWNQAHQIFDHGALSLSTVDSNGTVPPTSSHCSAMETLSQVPGTPTEGNALLLSDPGPLNKDEHERLHRFGDVEYLASLPRSVLEELSKNVADALVSAKQARKESVVSGGESSLQVHGERTARSGASKSHTTSNKLRCEHPGCTMLFQHNKDRLRHFRNKHQSNAKTFPCPVVDCPSGFGHKFPRSDKLRSHLGGKKILSLSRWSCVLPGCYEIAGSRADLIDHLGQHAFITRRINRSLIRDCGFASHNKNDYFWAKYICSIPECPFGTDDKHTMDAHLSVHHDGPFCPCPIPSCQMVFQDHYTATMHLARQHDRDTRERFRKVIRSQQFTIEMHIFRCPICHIEIIGRGPWTNNIRGHCREHNHHELVTFSEALVKAWTFSFGSTPVWDFQEFARAKESIVPYIVLPEKVRGKIQSTTDFELALARIRAAIELEMNA